MQWDHFRQASNSGMGDDIIESRQSTKRNKKASIQEGIEEESK
jgi:hypothetical protein